MVATPKAGSARSAPVINPPAPTIQPPAPVGDAPLIVNGVTPVRKCGEMVIPASSQVSGLVGRINSLWGTNFSVYQTVAEEQPHAATGGCILYNGAAMDRLMAGRLKVDDSQVADPLIWGVFAHELGHQYHHDTEPARDATPSAIRELEADRFAGYTLEKLSISASDLTPYWSMTGDEFGAGVSGGNQHGSSAQRTAAFRQGWQLAEWNRPENSGAVAEAGDDSVAPDRADGSPQ